VASYEYGFAKLLEATHAKWQRKLSSWDVDRLFEEFEKQPHWKPLVQH
jgi:hypothetical protein